MTALLEIRGLNKAFGGLRALIDLDLDVETGDIYGLIGPNGSGKSTALHVFNGFLRPSSGTIKFAGESIDGTLPHQRAARGMGRIFQTPAIFGDLTVLENVIAGCHILDKRSRSLSAIFFLPFAVARAERELTRHAMEGLEMVGLADQARSRAANLSYGDRKLLDLAKALVAKPRLLLCDEPAAGMSFQGIERLRSLLERLCREGTTVLIAEHNMKLVLGLCNRIAALNFGRKIFDGTPDAIRSDPAVIEAYLGSKTH